MLGLDTNILLRYVLKDDAAQLMTAARIIEKECTTDQPGFINQIVLCEFVWTLARAYDYPRARIVQVMAALLRVDRLSVEEPEEVASAVAAFEGGADFSDALVSMRNRRIGCSSTLTFDRRAARLPLMQIAR